MRPFGHKNLGPMVRNLGLFFAAITVLFMAVIGGQFPSPEQPYVAALSTKYYVEKGKNIVENISGKIGSQTLRNILKTELPVMSIADNTVHVQQEIGYTIAKVGLNILSGVQLDDPLTYLKAEIPMMDVTPLTPEAADSYDETGFDEITEEPGEASPTPPEAPVEVENKIKSEKPLIALYNTHTSETFELTDGLTHLKGKAGGVSIVALAMQKFIQEKYQIPVVYSPTLHDLSFNKSYAESQKTVTQLIKDNPGLEMIVDVHRDGSLTREQSLTKINGQSVAKILIVVGTEARTEHPKWRENLDFARKLAAKLDAMYPGLSRGIAIKEGRYNQNLSTKALLVEIGSSKNTTDEAVAAGKLFANAAVAVLNDLNRVKAAN